MGSVNPFELFLIYVELVEAEERSGTRIDYMIDQTHNIEPKIEAMLLSVMNLQEAYAKALLVDRAALAEARNAGDVLGAHRLLLDAYATDVRPLCARVRESLGGAPDPIAAFKESGYAERVARGTGRRRRGRDGVESKVRATRRANRKGGRDRWRREQRERRRTCGMREEAEGLSELEALAYRSNLLGSGPRGGQLRGRQHLDQGQREGPRRARGRCSLGEGFGVATWRP